MNHDPFFLALPDEASLRELRTDHQRLRWLTRAALVDVLPVRSAEAESALRAVQELNNLGGEALAQWLEGDIGSGIRLTARGRRLSVALLVMQQAEARLLKQLGGSFAEDLRLLDRVTVRTSARNQFVARVESLSGGSVQDEVALQLAGGQRMHAVVTHNSVEALGLKPGVDVVALIKAPSMRVLAPDVPAEAGSGRNRFEGQLRSLRRDARYAELMVDLGCGLTAVAVSPLASLPALECGQRVTLCFCASDVILGVPT